MNYSDIEKNDHDIYDLIKKEERRQKEGLEMIPSENYTSPAVMEAMGSILTKNIPRVIRERGITEAMSLSIRLREQRASGRRNYSACRMQTFNRIPDHPPIWRSIWRLARPAIRSWDSTFLMAGT